MKNILFLTCTILGLAWSAGCHKSDTTSQACADTTFSLPRDTFELCPGQSASLLTNNSVFVRFDTVVGDGRCPENATCIWAGVAYVQVTLANQSLIRTDTLTNNADIFPEEFSTATWGDLNFKIINVTPYPVDVNSIPIDDYRILCVVWQE